MRKRRNTYSSVRFSVPANFKLKTLEELSRINTDNNFIIEETYGSLNPSLMYSGRSANVIPKIDFNGLEKFLKISMKYGIGFNYTLNHSCTSNNELFDKERQQIDNYINRLVNIGVQKFTIASHTYLSLFYAYKNIDLTISTISQLYEPAGIKLLKNFSNVKRICLPEKMNRDLPLMRKIVELAAPIEICVIVNNMCLLNCPFRNQHYNYYSHNHPEGTDPNIVACSAIRINDPVNLLKSPWIRPEDIKTYVSSGISLFKVAGRGMQNADYPRMLKFYKAESFNGNLIHLFRAFSPNEYWNLFELPSEKINSIMNKILSKRRGCSDVLCDDCKICAEFIDPTSFVLNKQASKNYYKEYINYLKTYKN